ncbi:MAG: aldehyde dehydrogenase family protein [Bdellovibrio sp.]
MLEQIFLHQKQFSLHLRTESVDSRIEYLNILEQAIDNHIPEIVVALEKDFSKNENETLLFEIYPVLEKLRYVKKNLKTWVTAININTTLTLSGTKNFVVPEPRGVCLIIAPWNHPFQLALLPLISAIAAGNCAIIKPSEITIKTSALINNLIGHAFSEEHIKVIEGGTETLEELLNLPFDHIFCTGSPSTGKNILAASRIHLSPMTVELSGKSFAVVDATADLETAAEKIILGKFLNAGQTFFAPDCLFIQKEIYSEFKSILIKKVKKFYNDTATEENGFYDFTKIVSTEHTERLHQLLEDALNKNAVIIYGGKIDISNRYFSPTFLEKVDLHSSLMQDEILGPILPLIAFEEISEVIHALNEQAKPLVLYIYSHSDLNIESLIKKTSTDGICINHHLPFGGIGSTGLGIYNGYHGFKTFSHEKTVLVQSAYEKIFRILSPPYTDFKQNLFRNTLLRKYW